MLSTTSGFKELDHENNDNCCVLLPSFGDSSRHIIINNNNCNLERRTTTIRTSSKHDNTTDHQGYDDPTSALVQEFKSLSVEEREVVYEEIHGVASDVVETEELRQTSLSSMRGKIPLLPKRQRKVMDRAIFLKPRLLEDDHFLLIFLRAHQFDTRKAAEHICLHFEHKLELFGESKLVYPITLKDLTEQEKATLYRGMSHILPYKDRSGRTLRLMTYSTCNWFNWQSELRCTWYQNMTALKDNEDMQRKGTVNIVNCYGDFSGVSAHNMVKFILQAKNTWEQLAFRTLANHFCTDNPMVNSFLSNLYNIMSKEMKQRTKNHFGSPVEVSYKIRSFGINMKDELIQQPSDEVLRQKSEHYLSQRERIEEKERIERERVSNQRRLVTIPGPCDVLMGRGRACSEYCGNQHFRQYWVARFAQRFQQSDDSRLDKTLLAMELHQRLKEEEGGRFLQRTDLGWEVVDDLMAREKISQAFRLDAKRQRDASTTEVTPLGVDGLLSVVEESALGGVITSTGGGLYLPTLKRPRVIRDV